ncbi:MAG: hypothetical protein V4850_07420 [Myxococcota bacterium]
MLLNLRTHGRAALVTGLGLLLALGLQCVWLAWYTSDFSFDRDWSQVNPLLPFTTPFVAWFVARPDIPGRRAGALGFHAPARADAPRAFRGAADHVVQRAPAHPHQGPHLLARVARSRTLGRPCTPTPIGISRAPARIAP